MDENFKKIINELDKNEDKNDNNKEEIISKLPEWSIEPPLEIDRNNDNEL